jgi:hypothetical protein
MAEGRGSQIQKIVHHPYFKYFLYFPVILFLIGVGTFQFVFQGMTPIFYGAVGSALLLTILIVNQFFKSK